MIWMPGATSAPSSTSFQFFHFGKFSAMRLPAGLRPSGSFANRLGSVHQLYSVALTTSSALGNTGVLVPFSISPQTWSGWKWEIMMVSIAL